MCFEAGSGPIRSFGFKSNRSGASWSAADIEAHPLSADPPPNADLEVHPDCPGLARGILDARAERAACHVEPRRAPANDVGEPPAIPIPTASAVVDELVVEVARYCAELLFHAQFSAESTNDGP